MSRFSSALIVASLLHGALFIARWLDQGAACSPAAVSAASTELEIQFETTAFAPSAASIVGSMSAQHSRVEQGESRSTLPPLTRSSLTSNEATSPFVQPLQPIAASTSADEPPNQTANSRQPESTPTVAAKIDLGLDGQILRPRLADAREKPRLRRDVGADLSRELNASIVADDVARGHARGNVLIGSLTSAVRTVGPIGGEAAFQVTIDSQGGVDQVELIRGAASDWASALQSFRQQASRKRVRLPSGARGLRVTFSVSSKVQRASGKQVDSSGVSLNSPSLAPGGLAFMGEFDLADLSNKTSRSVFVTVVREEIL